MLLIRLINNAVDVYSLILIAYALMSWFPGAYNTPLGRWLEKVTTPYINLFKPLNLRFGMIDFTVAAAIFALYILRVVLLELLGIFLW